jgi:hypothetical protein
MRSTILISLVLSSVYAGAAALGKGATSVTMKPLGATVGLRSSIGRAVGRSKSAMGIFLNSAKSGARNVATGSNAFVRSGSDTLADDIANGFKILAASSKKATSSGSNAFVASGSNALVKSGSNALVASGSNALVASGSNALVKSGSNALSDDITNGFRILAASGKKATSGNTGRSSNSFARSMKDTVGNIANRAKDVARNNKFEVGAAGAGTIAAGVALASE